MKYQFEWADFRTVTYVINVVLIIRYGLIASWFGLALAVFGLCQALREKQHINTCVSYCATIILNGYFLSLL